MGWGGNAAFRMMPGWIFAAMAGIGCALLGQRIAIVLHKRCMVLAAWERMLHRLQMGIGYTDGLLASQLVEAAQCDTPADALVMRALRGATDRMQKDPMLPVGEAWRREDMAFTALTADDQAVLWPCLTALGALNRTAQAQALQASLQAISLQSTQATQRAQRDERLYRTLGGLGGLALFLCLL